MPEPISEPKRGDSIKAWAIRVTRELARLGRLLDVDGSSGLVATGGTLRFVGRQPGLVLVRLPASAIAARNTSTGAYSSGTANLCVDSGTAITVGTATVTVYNPYSAATTASKFAWCSWWSGKLWIVTTEC